MTVPSAVRLYNPIGPDRVAVVSARPDPGREGAYWIRVARGPGAKALGVGAEFGPCGEGELEGRFEELVGILKGQGFEPPGQRELLAALEDPNSAVRARAAARLGWRRSREAVGPLLGALGRAVDDVCAIVDALGAIGDPGAIPAVREQAGRKLLSRRRSGVEALRNLGDEEGLAEAAERARGQLPEAVRAALGGEEAGAIVAAVLGLEEAYRGLALDLLYEVGTPAAVEAVREAVEKVPFDRAFAWRYVKSLYKRAMLRHDAVTFGRLAHAIEAKGRQSAGTKAAVKSGYDGVQREVTIFGRRTQTFARRLGWRYLRNLASHRPELYPYAAAEALIAYTPGDAQEPSGLTGEFARCYLLTRILWGCGTRFKLDWRTLIFRFRDSKSTKEPAGVREEAYPELWDAQPRAYLRVLGGARLPEAHGFAVRALEGPHRGVLEAAGVDEVLPLLGAPHDPTVRLGLGELERRFDPGHPDLMLLDRILSDELGMARELGRRWLRESAPLWTRDQEWIAVFVTIPDARTALLAAELAAEGLRRDAGLRREIAGRILARLRAPEAAPGIHDAYARIGREALAEEIGALLSVPELVGLITGGSPPAQALAGDLLGRRPEAVAHLGLEGLAALAGHEVAAVRAAAHGLMRAAAGRFREDPSALFLLVESDWADTRGVAFDLLRGELGREALGAEGLMALLDSNRVDVQELGRELVLGHLGELDPRRLVDRLVEHPHPNMRRFALELVVGHWPDGAAALARLEGFFRAAVLDVWPERRVKDRVIAFLAGRGLRDEDQAEVAARLLGEFARLRGREDFERAMEALVRIKLAWPRARSPVAIGAGAGS